MHLHWLCNQTFTQIRFQLGYISMHLKFIQPSLQLHRFGEPNEVSSQTQCKGSHRSLQGTIYGYGQNSKGACAFGKNFADTTGLPWSTAPAGASEGGTGLPTTFIALNNPQFDGSASCGTCVWFRGTGESQCQAHHA